MTCIQLTAASAEPIRVSPGMCAPKFYVDYEKHSFTGSIYTIDDLAQWIEANFAKEVPVNRRASSDDLIAFHLQNAREPNAYTEMAAAMESFRTPPPWAKLLNKVSRGHAPKNMQKRYIELDEVNGLLQSLVCCNVRDRFVPAVVDEVGIKLQ